MSKNKEYQLLLESVQWKEALDKEETITLNRTKFAEVMKTRKAQIEKFKVLNKFKNNLKFSIFPDEVQREKTDEAFQKKTENWIKNLQKDVYLQEAMNVLTDMKKQKV